MPGIAALGPQRACALRHATIPYHDVGAGEPLLFVHGMYANSSWWRKIAPRFVDTHRVIVPDLPFGSHAVPASPDADLTPPGLAQVIADFMEALELENVTLVAGDLGGAVAQIVIANQPDRVGRLVLMSCDSYENFPPGLLKYQCQMSRLPGARMTVGFSARLMRRRWARRLPITFRYAVKHTLDDDLIDDWLEPLSTNPATQRDAVKILRGVNRRHTLAAARKFGSFRKPVLILWGVEDRLFPFRYAERLAQAFPSSGLEAVEDAYTYIVEDQPERVAAALASFLGTTDPNLPPAPAART